MNKYRVTFYHQKTSARVDVSTWANNEGDALTKAVETLANPLIQHAHTTVIESERP